MLSSFHSYSLLPSYDDGQSRATFKKHLSSVLYQFASTYHYMLWYSDDKLVYMAWALFKDIWLYSIFSAQSHRRLFFLKQGPFDDRRQAAQWLSAAPQCNSTVSQLAALNRLHRQVHSISYGASSSPLCFVWQIPPLFLWWCFSFVGTLACLVD